MGIFRSIWYYLPLFVTDTETISDVSSSLGEMTKLQSGFAMFFIVVTKTEYPKLCQSGLFRPKYNVKIRVLSYNLRKMGVQYGVFYSQASN